MDQSPNFGQLMGGSFNSQAPQMPNQTPQGGSPQQSNMNIFANAANPMQPQNQQTAQSFDPQAIFQNWAQNFQGMPQHSQPQPQQAQQQPMGQQNQPPVQTFSQGAPQFSPNFNWQQFFAPPQQSQASSAAPFQPLGLVGQTPDQTQALSQFYMNNPLARVDGGGGINNWQNLTMPQQQQIIQLYNQTQGGVQPLGQQ